MHIGVDATCWHNKRGYGRQGRSLLRALLGLDRGNRYTFFLDAPVDSEPLPPEAEVRFVRAAAPTAVAASSNGHRSLADLWRMSRALSTTGCDLLFFPTAYSYVPVLARAKKVVMIHDVIAEKYPQLTVPKRLARLLWKTKVALSRKQADAIVTVSEHSRLGIAEHFKIAPERIYVVGEASDPVFRRLEDPQPTPRLRALGLDGTGRTVTYVGGFGPHKNLETLIAVFSRLAAQEEFAEVRLALVGEHEKEAFFSQAETLKQQIRHLGIDQRVVFTGYLSDEELVVLLNLSTVLVLPSLLEGFGLPGVEAAACGCPVIATTASPLPALLGEGGLFVEPADARGWETAVAAVLRSTSVRQRMRCAALDAARQLSWEASARQLLHILQEVAA